MSHAISNTCHPHVFYANRNSLDIEEQAIVLAMHDKFAKQCVDILKEISCFPIPLNAKLNCSVSVFSFTLQEYLFSKGCSISDVIEADIDFNDVVVRMNTAAQAIKNQNRITSNNYYALFEQG